MDFGVHGTAYFGGPTGESYLAVTEKDELLSEAQGLADVVGDEEDCLVEREDKVLQFAAENRVEGRERFIEQEHRRVARECAGEGNALLLAAAELVRVMIEQGAFKAERLGECFDAERMIVETGDLLASGEVGEEAEVLLDKAECAAELKRVVVSDGFLVVSDVTGRGQQELVDEAEKGALSTAAPAEDGGGCLGRKANGDAAQDLAATARDMHRTEVDHNALRSGRRIEKVVLPGTELKRMLPSCWRMMR